LEAMLAGLGPRRTEAWRNGMSSDEFMQENRDLLERDRKIEAMFERRFRQRITDAYNEACETGTIEDAELEDLLRTRKMNHDEAIISVSKRLKALAAELFTQQ